MSSHLEGAQGSSRAGHLQADSLKQDSKAPERQSSPNSERKVINSAVVVALASVALMVAFYAFTGSRYTAPPRPPTAAEKAGQSMKLEMDQLKTAISSELYEMEKDISKHFGTFETLKYELSQLRKSLATKEDYAKLQRFDTYSARVASRVDSMSNEALQKTRSFIRQLFSQAKTEFKASAKFTTAEEVLSEQLLQFETEFQRQLQEQANILRGDLLQDVTQFDARTRGLITQHVNKHLTGEALRSHILRIARTKKAAADVELGAQIGELLKTPLSADFGQSNKAIDQAKTDLRILYNLYGDNEYLKEGDFNKAVSSAADSVDAKLRKDKNVALYNSMRDYIVLSGLDSTELTVGNRKLVMVVPTEASVLPYTTPLSPFEVTKFGDSPARTEASAVLDFPPVDRSYFAFRGAEGGFSIRLSSANRVAGFLFRQSPAMKHKSCTPKSVTIEGQINGKKRTVLSLDSFEPDHFLPSSDEETAYESFLVHVTANNGDKFTCISGLYVYGLAN